MKKRLAILLIALLSLNLATDKNVFDHKQLEKSMVLIPGGDYE